MNTSSRATIAQDAAAEHATAAPEARTENSAAPDGFVHRLLFAPESAWPIAITRIILGLALLGWTVSMMLDASDFLSPDGLFGIDLASSQWRLLALETDRSVWIALVALAIAAIFVVVGFRPTPFLLLSFFLMVAIQRRSPYIQNTGDNILTNLVFLLAFAPSSAALSVDRWRKHGRSALRSAPHIAPFGVRLIQLQMMLAYFFTFWVKSGTNWIDGTAVSTALRLKDLQRFAAPDFVITSVPITAMLTWGALALELSLGLFLWNKRMRPYLIVGGLTLHLLIEGFLVVGFFGISMIAGLLTFLDGDMIQRRLDRRFLERS